MSFKSFWIELLAVEFIAGWEYAGNGPVYYDWMIRDFFTFLCKKANGFVLVPGTQEIVSLGDNWLSKAQTACSRAKEACEYEAQGYHYAAGGEWHEIFGTDIPIS